MNQRVSPLGDHRSTVALPARTNDINRLYACIPTHVLKQWTPNPKAANPGPLQESFRSTDRFCTGTLIV